MKSRHPELHAKACAKVVVNLRALQSVKVTAMAIVVEIAPQKMAKENVPVNVMQCAQELANSVARLSAMVNAQVNALSIRDLQSAMLKLHAVVNAKESAKGNAEVILNPQVLLQTVKHRQNVKLRLLRKQMQA